MKVQPVLVAPWRRFLLLGTFGLALTGLLARAFYVQIWARDFYRRYGDRQEIGTATLPAHRGRLLDRHGVPLALSAPVKAVCVNPRVFHAEPAQLRRLARLLETTPAALARRIQAHRRQAFLYLKRQVTPGRAREILALDIDGLSLRPEFRRYYPAAEVTAHLLGFTDIDQRGQEGLERRFDARLTGMAGEMRVIRDRKGRVIEAVESLQPPRPGHDVRLSIDRRLQYWAYLELKRAVVRHHARAGMLVMLDAGTGEVLALANQPTFNPNLRDGRHRAAWRNRAVTDVFEPGSTLKPFAMACALRAGVARIGERVDTAPGWLRVGRHLVRDHHRHDVLDLAGILVKSSNVGITQVALRLTPAAFTRCLEDFGFGRRTGIEFPGEAAGFVPAARGLGRFEQATLAFGYGLSVSTLQLARAYALLADDGVRHSLTLLPRSRDPQARRVLPAKVARQVRHMLEGVVTSEGTARRAQVAGYRVAGKTGTAKVAIPGGYAKDRYRALFVGMAPASDPRLVLAVVIEEPRGKEYYGGQVAAPVFSRVMGLALRLLGIPPDEMPAPLPLLARAGGRG